MDDFSSGAVAPIRPKPQAPSGGERASPEIERAWRLYAVEQERWLRSLAAA